MYKQFQNGRVIELNNNKLKPFKLFTGSIPNYDFQNKAVEGIYQKNTLNQVYFSKANMDIVQNMIRHQVWLASDKKYVIGRQSDTDLEVVMRSYYLQYSRNLDCNIAGQIRELNTLTVGWCVPRILSEVQQYMGYVNDVEHMPMPIELPKNLSQKGTRTLRSVTTTF